MLTFLSIQLMSHASLPDHFPSLPHALWILWGGCIAILYQCKLSRKCFITDCCEMKLHFLTALPQECGHVAFTNIKSKGWARSPGQLCHHSHSSYICGLGIKKRHHTLNHKQIQAVGERHVGKKQLRETTTCGDNQHGSSEYFRAQSNCGKKQTYVHN